MDMLRDESREYTPQPPGSEHLYWSQPHDIEAVALLAPKRLLYGWRERAGLRKATEVLGRAGYRVAFERWILFDDPRMMGHELCPNFFDNSDELELIVDAERGVIVEWRFLLHGEVYERFFFSEIAFDVPVERSEFEIKGHG